MKADQAIAEQFINLIAKVDVSSGFKVASRDGCITFNKDDSRLAADPAPMAQRITKNLGVRMDYYIHNGLEYAWDLPGDRRMFFVAKEWGEIEFGLLDFKAQ